MPDSVIEPSPPPPGGTSTLKSIGMALLAICPCTAPAVWLFNKWEKGQDTTIKVTEALDVYALDITVLDENDDTVPGAVITVLIGSLIHEFQRMTNTSGRAYVDVTSEVLRSGITTVEVMATKDNVSYINPNGTIVVKRGDNKITLRQS